MSEEEFCEVFRKDQRRLKCFENKKKHGDFVKKSGIKKPFHPSDPHRVMCVDIWNSTVSYVESHSSLFQIATPRIHHGCLEKRDLDPIHAILERKSHFDVHVVHQDSIDCALEYRKRGLKVLVLNMASDKTPGGGVRTGASAQEECLFRRSDYFRHLHTGLTYSDKSIDLYPLEERIMVINPNVTVIRDSSYNMLDPSEFQTLDFIAISGIRNPRLKPDGDMTEEDKELLRDKITQMLQAGLFYGYDVLVLGALGCGAFRNPPDIVAQLFHEQIKLFKEKYPYAFEEIVFAVLTLKTDNFQIFYDRLND